MKRRALQERQEKQDRTSINDTRAFFEYVAPFTAALVVWTIGVAELVGQIASIDSHF